MPSQQDLEVTAKWSAPLPVAANGSRLARRIVWIVGLLAMLLLGLITLAMVAAETGSGALTTGIALAIIPVPIYILLLLWIDRYEREPSMLLGLAFLWGASVAAFLSYCLNTYVTVHAAALFGADKSLLITAVLASPLTEEFAKGLALFILYFWRRDEFDGVMDGIVYAGMVGLGFAMFENVLYYGKAVVSGSIEETFILRGFLAPFSHPLFTSMTGIGLGLARLEHRQILRWLYPALGFLLAISLHFVWNWAAASGHLDTTYDHVMAPIFSLLLGIIGLEMRREGKLLQKHLLPEVDSGLFTHGEYEELYQLTGRLRSSWRALRRAGLNGWCQHAKVQHAASELAFYRNRMAKGLDDRSLHARTEAELLQALRRLCLVQSN